MALLTLRDIYKKKGNEFIDELFKSYVIISEQIDGSRFMFQKQFDDSIVFYKKVGTPIGVIDRTLMCFYEKAIDYISNLPNEILDKIPDNWTFGFQYFPSLTPIKIVYDRLPKNNLVLTDISIRNESGRVIKVINDPKVLSDWATILDVEQPPIIFSGYLDSQQKDKIRNFLETNDQDLDSLFKAESFTRYIISVLNPKLKTTALSNSLDKDIEAIVFKFIKSGEAEYYTAKLIDPVFYHTRKELGSKKKRKANDMYQIAMLDIVEFMEQQDFEKIMLAADGQEERYVELISILFNEYVSTNGHKYVGVNFNVPEFAKRAEFNVNLDFVKNARTKEILDNDYMRNLYKIMLSSFRKHRKKATDILTDTVINSLNEIVDKIENKVREENTGSGTMDFQQFLKSERYQNEKSIFEEEIFEALQIDHEHPGLEKVNFIVGRFQPFTLGHIKVFQRLHKENGLPVVVLIVRGKNPNPEKSPFPVDMQMRMFANLQKQYKFLEAIHVIHTAGIDTIFNALRPAYEPVLWGAGTDRKKAYQYQIDRYSEELNAREDFKVHEIKRTDEDISASKVRNALMIEDYKTFSKMTPKSVHKMYDELKNHLADMAVANESEKKDDLITESLDLDNIEDVTFRINESEINDFKLPMQASLFKESFDDFLEDWNNTYGKVINEDIDSAINRLKQAVDTIEIPDRHVEDKIEKTIINAAEYVENFKPISDIHGVFVDEKGFSDDDFEKMLRILKKDNEESLANLAEYVKNPYDVSYFIKKGKSVVNLAKDMSKDIGVSEQTLRYLFNMDGNMKGGKGVGRGELYLGLMINGASNASVGDVNVNGVPYEVKAQDARLNTQNGFGNGKAAVISFMGRLEKIDPKLAKKYVVKNKEDIKAFNLQVNRTDNTLFQILNEAGNNLSKILDAATEGLYTGPSGIWPNANGSIRKQVRANLKWMVGKDWKRNWDEFTNRMLYANMQYYQSQEYFNGIFFINDKTGMFAYFDMKSSNPKWLQKYIKPNPNQWQDNPTSNCYKVKLIA